MLICWCVIFERRENKRAGKGGRGLVRKGAEQGRDDIWMKDGRKVIMCEALKTRKAEKRTLLLRKGVLTVVMKNWQPLVLGPEFYLRC